jgi:hypothetical protein
MKRRLMIVAICFGMFLAGTARADVAFSVSREPGDGVGVPGSALNNAWRTGTLPNTIYNSDLTGTNTVGLSGQKTGTSGTQGSEGNRPGRDVDAVHFGPSISSSAIQKYYFSLDYGSGNSGIPYPEGSGTASARGTGTAPSNIYGSLANGTNFIAFSCSSLGIVPEEEGNVDAFNLSGFVDPTSYPAYFSLDLGGDTDIDFDEDGTTDITVNGADILYSAGEGTFSIYMPASLLGLNDSDNLDALVRLSDGSWLFSVDYESEGLEDTAVYDAGGTGRRPANIYLSYGDGTNSLWLSSEALGLPSGLDGENGWGVNLDALDVGVVPEPATICLLGLGALSLLRRKRSV